MYRKRPVADLDTVESRGDHVRFQHLPRAAPCGGVVEEAALLAKWPMVKRMYLVQLRIAPFEMKFVVDKLNGAHAKEIWQTDRGTTFGYQNLVVDMRSFPIMASYGHPTIMDATHAVQLPGAAGGASGGQREYVPVLAKAALAAGADGLFMETHPDPSKAISDGPSQVPLADFPVLVESCLKIWKAARG
jgi:3-deoxy-8-phosphooctulonate synthase